MLGSRCLIGLTLLAAMGLPVLAKPAQRLMQTHVNLTLNCQDLAGTLQNLQGLAGQLGGVTTNSNLQVDGGSANANLRLPPEQVPAFLAKARGMGDVQTENVSTSDNTRSWDEARANLELAEKMASVEWGPKSLSLTPQEKMLMDAEFKNYLRERINSYRGNLANYEEYRKWAEVSLTLQSQPRTRRAPAPAEQLPPVQTAPAATPTPPTKAHTPAGLLILPSVFLGVCLAYFIFSRRSERS